MGWKLPIICSTLTGILIITILINENGIVSKILSNKILTIIGKISYGIYLIHYFMLPYVAFDSTIKNFFVIFIFSACLSYVSFVTIETYLNKVYKKIISCKFFTN